MTMFQYFNLYIPRQWRKRGCQNLTICLVLVYSNDFVCFMPGLYSWEIGIVRAESVSGLWAVIMTRPGLHTWAVHYSEVWERRAEGCQS